MLKNKNYNNIFHIWLLCLIVLVSLIIIVGGLTRLTDSGLSITEWELIKGIFPPTNSNDWNIYFESYKKIPQYILVNNNMTLSEFKYIFLWEYAHRLLARFIGIFFLIPFLFFIFINSLKRESIYILGKIFILILIQGSIGWYMVKSGLSENVTVSHYRLSIHLFIAFSILSSIVWLLFNSLNNDKKKFFQLNFDHIILKVLLVCIYIQIILGAFVSGLDAGKIYQSWPLMNGDYFPDDVTLENFLNFNQPSVVQFFHRNVAYCIFFLTIFFGYNIYKMQKTKLFSIYLFFLLFIIIQIVLGISVLLSGANIYFASLHQISSIFLIIAILKLYHRSISS
ncbi:COX15/CtaA family protein [Pelagibacteraceae bacterium]|nr:COX15/CtaA family protein [Pelagibacteraceae bacterium]